MLLGTGEYGYEGIGPSPAGVYAAVEVDLKSKPMNMRECLSTPSPLPILLVT